MVYIPYTNLKRREVRVTEEKFQVEFFETDKGTKPAIEFLNGLDTKMLYFFYYHGRIIVTNGFVKKTQKTPTQDKKLAEKYRSIFLAREAEKGGKYE